MNVLERSMMKSWSNTYLRVFCVWPLVHSGHDVIGPHLRRRLVLTRCPIRLRLQHTVNRGYVYRQRFTAQSASPPVYYQSMEQ